MHIFKLNPKHGKVANFSAKMYAWYEMHIYKLKMYAWYKIHISKLKCMYDKRGTFLIQNVHKI